MFTFSFAGKNVYIVQSSGRDTNNHLMDLILFIQVIGQNIKLQIASKKTKTKNRLCSGFFCEIKKHKKISKTKTFKTQNNLIGLFSGL